MLFSAKKIYSTSVKNLVISIYFFILYHAQFAPLERTGGKEKSYRNPAGVLLLAAMYLLVVYVEIKGTVAKALNLLDILLRKYYNAKKSARVVVDLYIGFISNKK